MSLSFISSTCFATSHRPWENKQWLKLLRYNSTLIGYESEVDSQEYFFSKNGKTNPKDEYNASLGAFNQPIDAYKNINKHPICSFPGRYSFLSKIDIKVQRFDLSNCKDFWNFKTKINLDSISVIFSSFYIDKPASAFGHTLLKLNSKNSSGIVDLNSYGVDFSAQVTTKNPFLYGVYGIIGGFYGRFSLLPYFLKLREYNDFESRDLWEFVLNLTADEKELFTAHLWDMNYALFDYFYFSENCSYHVLRIIDAIAPRFNLKAKLKKLTIPIDTLSALIDEDASAIEQIYFRPSSQKRVASILKELTLNEKNFVFKALNEMKIPEKSKLSDKELARSLDAIIEIVDYKFSKKIYLEKENSIQDFKRQVLIVRSQTLSSGITVEKKIVANTFNIPHGTRSLGLGVISGDRNGYSLSYRSALHNILEPSGDTYDNFTLEMNSISLFLDQGEQSLVLDDYQFANVLTLRPLNQIENKLSWNFNLGAKSNDYDKDFIAPYLRLGLGTALNLGEFIGYSFLRVNFDNITSQRKYRNNSFGAEVGFVYPGELLRGIVKYTHLFDFSYLDESTRSLSIQGLYTIDKSVALGLDISSQIDNNCAGAKFYFKY